jgi:hypothetical protein
MVLAFVPAHELQAKFVRLASSVCCRAPWPLGRWWLTATARLTSHVMLEDEMSDEACLQLAHLFASRTVQVEHYDQTWC